MIPFDKEKFLRYYPDYGFVLEKIDSCSESEKDLARFLQAAVDRLWEKCVDKMAFNSLVREDNNYKAKVANALREVADKIESRGPHYVAFAKLPNLPVFSGEFPENRFCTIVVRLHAAPLGA